MANEQLCSPFPSIYEDSTAIAELSFECNKKKQLFCFILFSYVLKGYNYYKVTRYLKPFAAPTPTPAEAKS